MYIILQFVVFALWGLWILKREYQQSQGLRLNQVKYLLIAEIVGWGGGATNYLLWYDIPVRPYGNILVSVYTGIFAYAMVRYRLLDVDIVIKKSLVYALLLIMLLVPCYAVVFFGQAFAFGNIDYGFSLSTLFLFIVVAFYFPKIRFKTEDALERVLFKKRTDYRETLLRSSRDMVSIVDTRALSENLVRTVGKSLGIEKVSLLLSNDSKNAYHLEASVGLNIEQPETVLLPRDGPLVQLLQRRREPIVREELEWVPVGPETPQTIETMGKLGAEISLPITSKDRLIGILNLGHKDDKTIYSDEDLELLSTLANQAAIAIENARLYENLKQSQDTLRRADRLSSLGLLTAGLAHEIRNPLVAIRTFTQLLPERYDDAEFREGFQGLALKEVDRICGLITDLLSFARPSKPNVAPENVNDVVDNIARILESQAKEKNVEISREFGADLPKVWIDREQMKQVFMNLILNAIQAMKVDGAITISTRAITRSGVQPAGEFVQVEIKDTVSEFPKNLQHILIHFHEQR
jgi:K+-sensing histidine kinase KdpD